MEKVPVLGWTQSTIDSKDTRLTSGDPLQSGHTQPPPPRHSSANCQSYPSMFYCCPSRGMYLSPRLLSFLLCTLYTTQTGFHTKPGGEPFLPPHISTIYCLSRDLATEL